MSDESIKRHFAGEVAYEIECKILLMNLTF